MACISNHSWNILYGPEWRLESFAKKCVTNYKTSSSSHAISLLVLIHSVSMNLFIRETEQRRRFPFPNTIRLQVILCNYPTLAYMQTDPLYLVGDWFWRLVRNLNHAPGPIADQNSACLFSACASYLRLVVSNISELASLFDSSDMRETSR